MMMCVRLRVSSSSLFSSSSSSSTFSLLTPKPSSLSLSLSSKSKPKPTTRKFSTKMSAIKSQTIEHVVLFNVKDDTDSSKINSMITNLNSLTSLDQVLHLTAGPILRNRSSSFNFTHLLHSRYKSKEDLNGYAVHPNHMTVVKESVLPICEDIMAVDWISDLEDTSIVVKPGSAMRLTFLKLKEDVGENEKGKVLDVIGGIKDKFDSIDQISFGENFSARAKGFSIASIAVFRGVSELDGLDKNEEIVKEQKEKVKDLLESVIVLDYVVPASQSANL